MCTSSPHVHLVSAAGREHLLALTTEKVRSIAVDQKTRPYILAAFRDIKISNTPEYPRILKRHCKEKLARKVVFQRTY